MAKQQYGNELKGVLFKNDKKTETKHPDYNGSCQIDGVEYWISGWIKESKTDSKKFISFAFKPKDESAASSRGSKKEVAPPEDDVPF